jgi:hypothetical protein
VWPWAGELRTVAIAKDDTMFALPARIATYLSDVLARLPREGDLRGLPADRLADRLTYYLAEINAVHPFREGNGRTPTRLPWTARRGRGLPPRLGAADRGAQRRGLGRRDARRHRALGQALGEILMPAAQGGRDLHAARFPAPVAYATRAAQATRRPTGTTRPERGAGIER